jgi:hypothetical protein
MKNKQPVVVFSTTNKYILKSLASKKAQRITVEPAFVVVGL